MGGGTRSRALGTCTDADASTTDAVVAGDVDEDAAADEEVSDLLRLRASTTLSTFAVVDFPEFDFG